MGPDSFLSRCLLLDIEINEKNEIYSVGAVHGRDTFLTEPGNRVGETQAAELDNFGRRADFVLGHNILSHDIPRLTSAFPSLKILEKPAIDTLYLSPLAFPENPYHRLVKNYKLVRDSVNNPAEDALLAGKVFTEQWQVFAAQLEAGLETPLLYRNFLSGDNLFRGTALALDAMGAGILADSELCEVFFRVVREKVCVEALERVRKQLAGGNISLPPFAYVTAWLTVAEGNSVLPAWVRHRFPEVSIILHQLREQPCRHSSCSYCVHNHDPRFFLQSFFGFDDFRPAPKAKDGGSLQEEIVRAGARSLSLFAILPTGGGKSLCYLLPALMRYQRRNLLTIVISPLQALMKDQVDNFSRQTGTSIAGALYGMLTLPERSELRERVRLGDIGILYVSPEQLRNTSFIRVIQQREIGAWVFDEAHCLSKWGHDFRPDYLYSIRFIREFAQREKTAIPPVQCFTATAKKDVRDEIIDIIQRELGLKVTTFAGGHERTNLQYEVWPVEPHEKQETILQLLRSRYTGAGSVVIYCATRKKTEQLAELLVQNGFTAEAFHAGLEPMAKKQIQDDFIAGAVPVICATNAFGMGIDKEDVRLVIHADIPGSLENYLQEAGRAGRDRKEANCILVYSEADIEGRFRMSCLSRLTRREIGQFLRGLRYASKDDGAVVLTTGELLRLDVVDVESGEGRDRDTRVRTAISWLERAGFLQRNENNTRVFQGRPAVRTLEEARKRIAELDLSIRQQERWMAILQAFMEDRPDKGFSADELAGISCFQPIGDDNQNETETQRVIRTLNDMADADLLAKETTLTAYIRYKVQGSSEKRLHRTSALETGLLQVLQEELPDPDVNTLLYLDLRQVNQRLLNQGFEYTTPHGLRLLFEGWSRDGKGIAGRKGSISIRARGGNTFSVMLHRDWQSLAATVEIRQRAAEVALRTIINTVPADTLPGAALLAEFAIESIVENLKRDMLLLPRLKDPFAAAERALTFLHELEVIALQQGLAVFRQAMTIRLNPQARGRRFLKTDFAPLATHYLEKTFQVHVMNEYALSALKRISVAMNLVTSYFNDERDDFIKRFFPGREKLLERATSEQSYQRIVEDLENPVQEQVVAAETDRNMLILAGPGSGKTRTVAHRVAYLLRVQRVRPEAILVLCFNRSAIVSLRKRIRDLAGDDMNGVTTLTFHGLALRLTGRSLVPDSSIREDGDADVFADVITDAISLLQGNRDVLGLGEGEARDILMARFSHILLDEYQDIDKEQYEIISLLAGRTLEDSDRKLAIFAVGDDDQNIYRFRGASVNFIRQFKRDYRADVVYMIENYRSSAHIIAAANTLIFHNRNRMKTDHPIRINTARASLPEGGSWEYSDPEGRGLVACLEVADDRTQAAALLEELQRLFRLRDDVQFRSCAVLAREWRALDSVRSVLERENIPVSLNWGRSGFPRLIRIREYATLLDYLRSARLESLTAESLLAGLPCCDSEENMWQADLRRLLVEWREETGNLPQPVAQIEQYLYETLCDQYRSGTVNNGVFLSTVHSAKGLEFDHVFILDGGWQQKTGDDLEEERRLYYVAMSRARETLCLFQQFDRDNPHSRLLDGPFLLRSERSPECLTTIPTLRYHLLGMKDLYLDFAGTHSVNHPVRQALTRLTTGDGLQVRKRGENLFLLDAENIPVARLSQKACQQWRNQLDSVTDIRVVAMVRRFAKDIREHAFQQRCYGESWEVPVIEFCCSA